jgi:myosin protein heavy chain
MSSLTLTLQLETALETLETSRTKEARSVRNVDRTVKDLELQITRRDKVNAQLADDVAKARDRVGNLLQTIEELQSSDSTNQLQAKRAERELREEREKALRLERELEGWKALRMERSEMRRSGTFKALSDYNGSIRGKREGSATPSEGGSTLRVPGTIGTPRSRVSSLSKENKTFL